MKTQLRTEKEFLSLSIPLPPEQETELERSLIKEGCREPIAIWNEVIIDGHKRYQICKAEGIGFPVEEKAFPSEEEAISWVCRRRIPGYAKKSVPYRYLVGRFYNAQKQIYRVVRKQPEDCREIRLNPNWDRASYYVAEELDLHHATVENHGTYANAMDQIAEKAPKLFQAIMEGTVTVPRKEVLDCAALEDKDLAELCRKRWGFDDDDEGTSKIRIRQKQRKAETPINEIPISVGIKEMPVYDPDMELRGLTLTIPTWIMAIARVENNIEQATANGKVQLAQSLLRLGKQIDELLGVIGYGRE